MRNCLVRVFPFIVVLALVSVFLGCGGKNSQKNVIVKENRILDSADLLTPEQEDSIFLLIKDLESNIGSQIALLTVSFIEGETINEFSIRIAEKMGLGRKEFDDGVLITLAVGNKQARIEVGKGLELIVKDEVAARILREDMIPQFRQGDFFSGVKTAVKKIKKLIEENKELIGKRPQ